MRGKALIILILLVAQNSFQAIIMKLASDRARILEVEFSNVSLMATAECLKIVASLAFIRFDVSIPPLQRSSDFKAAISLPDKGVVLLAVMYAFQNQLMLFSAKRLSPTLFIIITQTKLLTAALFAFLLLRRTFSSLRVSALLLLLLGVCLAQINPCDQQLLPNNSSAAYVSSASASESSEQLIATLALLGATLMSGLAGSMSEKLIKRSDSNAWIFSSQMAVASLVINAAFPLFLSSKPIFQGFNTMVWCVCFLMAAGGIVVVATLKHADNILKGYATSVSMLVTASVSPFIFATKSSIIMFFAVSIVAISIRIYNSDTAAASPSPPPPESTPLVEVHVDEQHESDSSR